MLDNPKIAKRVRIIQRVYIGLSCFAIFAFISAITQASRKESLEYVINSLIFVFIYITMYIGLKKQCYWVIPLILITSILVLVQTLFAIIEPALNMTTLIAKLVQFLHSIFYWSQRTFFETERLKQYFDQKEP